jgi:protein-tyrosine phosphatase
VKALAAAVMVATLATACGSSGSKSATPTTLKPGTKVPLVMDVLNTPDLPRNFRIDADLRQSGSSVFSESALQTIKNKLATAPIVDVDLRQESHLYVNGIPVTWFQWSDDDANLGKTHEQVLADEAQKKQELLKDPSITFDTNKKAVQPTGAVPVQRVQTEEELVSSAGLGYFRLTVPDHLAPQKEEVDRFVAFVRDLPPGAWLHFHCRAGIGRTTTFMALYDMMRNAKSQTLDQILQHQVSIGGKDLTASDADADENKAERARFLQQFYDYVKNNNDGFKTPFSASAHTTTSS